MGKGAVLKRFIGVDTLALLVSLLFSAITQGNLRPFKGYIAALVIAFLSLSTVVQAKNADWTMIDWTNANFDAGAVSGTATIVLTGASTTSGFTNGGMFHTFTTNIADFTTPSVVGTNYPRMSLGNSSNGSVASKVLTLSFDETVEDPVVHLINLDNATADFSSTVTSTGGAPSITVISSNPELERTGLVFNSSPSASINIGCEAIDGSNPNGGCGSLRFDGFYDQIVFLVTDTNPSTKSGDGWAFSVMANGDHSDAPITATNYGAASHLIFSTIYLGAGVTPDDGDYDDASAAGDVDDGVSIPSLTQGSNATITVDVVQAAANDGYLQGWVDWNGDGDFADAGEQVATDLQLASGTSGTINVPVTAPATATTSQTFARFRWSSTSGLDSTAAAPDGEVEDYALTIEAQSAPAPSGVQSCNAFTGAWSGSGLTRTSTTSSGVGVTVSFSSDLGAEVVSIGTDTMNNINAWSEPSVQGAQSLVAFYTWDTSPESVTANAADDSADSFVTITFNEAITNPILHLDRLGGNGSTPSSVYYSNGARWTLTTPGASLVRLAGPAHFETETTSFYRTPNELTSSNTNSSLSNTGTSAGSVMVEGTYTTLTFRLDGFGVEGIGGDGIELVVCAPSIDRSDAPILGTNYGETYHSIDSDIRLGAQVDADPMSLASANANGDDTDGVDDEDGVTLPVMMQGSSATIPVVVSQTAANDGYLQSWIDWNGDGDFADAGEQIATDLQLGSGTTGTINVPVTVPVTATINQTFARFRWSTTAALDATSPASDGEVEDYALTIIGGQMLSGIIFEDIDYGGGAGRDQTTSSGVGVNGVTVELYDNTGAFVSSTTTANDGTNDGAYSFSAIVAGDYYIRVVSDTLSSTRTGSDGSELAVQTYRTDGSTPVTGEVGGRVPTTADGSTYNSGSPSTLDTTNFTFAGGTLGTAQAQSVTPITVASADISGIDFGFNFDTIVNTNDSGQGSLGQFILNSNLLTDIPNQGINSGQETSIFMIPDGTGYAGTAAHGALDLTSAGVATIATSAGLPAITDNNTAIDGGTQSGTSCAAPRNLTIQLDGSGTALNSGINGLDITGDGALLRALSVGGFDGHGVELRGDDADIICNHLGLNAAGTAATPNIHRGMFVTGSTDVRIGDGTLGNRNILSGNTTEGLFLNNTKTGIVVDTNYLGTALSGMTALGNGSHGLFAANIDAAGSQLTIQNNVSSGNAVSGVYVINSDNLALDVNNNLLGQAASGTAVVANGGHGLHISGGNNGSSVTTVTSNTLSGNNQNGIWLANATDVTVINNNIGTDTAGTVVGNGGFGIRVLNSTSIAIGDGSSGGSNTLAGNGNDGVSVFGTSEVTITRNAIYDNAGLGIDLGAVNNVTINEANDSDTGPNALLNFPQFSQTSISGGNLTLSGCAPAGSTIEVFEADVSPTSASGATSGDNEFGMTQDYGEGEAYIATLTEGVGEDTAATPVNCNAFVDADGNNATGMSPFQWTIALPASLVINDLITATATIAGTGTSEFSAKSEVVSFDYGDAPDTYGTSKAANGAEHSVINDVYLGSTRPDTESDGMPGAAADSDDNNNGSNDEDGASALPALTPLDRTYRITVNATNLSAQPGRLIAWIDFDRNGTFDADEAAARMVPTGTSSGNFVVAWSSIPPDIQQGQSYLRLRFTTDSINAGEASGLKADGEVEDYALAIGDAGATVSGRVFIDANSNTTDDSEAGISNTVVVLRDLFTGTCRSVNTNGNGDYSFSGIEDGGYEIYQAHGETTPLPQNCATSLANNPTGYQSTTADILYTTVAGADVNDQDFGEVAGTNSPTSGNTGSGIAFEPDHQSEVLPGNTAFYAHVFSSEAEGWVSFTTADNGNLATGWTHTLYRDSDCNGTLNGAEVNTAISGTNFAMAAGSSVCIIDKVYAPANAPAQDHYEVKTTATFTFAGSVAPATLEVTDLTIAGQTDAPTTQASPETGASRLELTKTVENLTQATPETETSNQAKPGDFLKYRIYYRNAGTGPITDLKVDDSVPPLTGFVGSSNNCDVTPSGMTCTPTINIDELNWDFTGSLVGGASGQVSYEVMVDN